MLNIDDPNPVKKFALFNSGFRVFFLAAGVFAVISMLIWMLYYSFNTGPELYRLTSLSWHAHEMIYGYSLAVISGFLLTATTNWTNRKTLTGVMLGIVSLFWIVARISPFINSEYNLEIMFISETLFFLLLVTGIAKPIFQSRQWQQLPVLLPVFLLFLSDMVFFAGQIQLISNGSHVGLYAGFYLILMLIFVMGRRVIPFFIEKGVDEGFAAKNYLWLDKIIIPLFFTYAVFEIFKFNALILMLLALTLFVLNMIRLAGWYTPGIWKKSLLWVLLLAYGFITLGFALRSLSYFINISDFIVLHAYAVGGIGLITLGMMSRVALGHTGRNVFEPPVILGWIFALLLVAFIFRVIFPLFLFSSYTHWVMLSQMFWIGAFSLFVLKYGLMFIKPRIDGRPG